MTTRRMLIAGNWKMNLLSAEGAALARAVAQGANRAGLDYLVCPASVVLPAVAAAAKGSALNVGGQDCHDQVSGAFTGDISAEMLADAGASHVILGHSERRHGLGETDEWVRAKVEAAWRAGLSAILCVGETREEREAGQAFQVVSAQLFGSIPPKGATPENLIIAYEPVWAIGTGLTPTIEDIAAMHGHIRSFLAATYAPGLSDGVRILYGGSLKPANAQEILALKDVDGGLIGGASLKAEDFLAIANATPMAG